jgi:hypothetical protein
MPACGLAHVGQGGAARSNGGRDRPSRRVLAVLAVVAEAIARSSALGQRLHGARILRGSGATSATFPARRRAASRKVTRELPQRVAVQLGGVARASRRASRRRRSG